MFVEGVEGYINESVSSVLLLLLSFSLDWMKLTLRGTFVFLWDDRWWYV